MGWGRNSGHASGAVPWACAVRSVWSLGESSAETRLFGKGVDYEGLERCGVAGTVMVCVMK